MGGISIKKQFVNAYPILKLVEEDFFVWKNGSNRRIYIKPEWHNNDYQRYFQLWICGDHQINVAIPFKFKRIYKVMLVDQFI